MMSPFTGTEVTCCASLEGGQQRSARVSMRGGAASPSRDSSQGIAADFTVDKNKYDLYLDFLKNVLFIHIQMNV